MNYFEKKFIDSYIVLSKKDRLYFELNNPKKRINFILRFDHNSVNYLKKNCINYCGNINDICIKLSNKHIKYYVLSYKYIDGKIMDYNEFYEYVTNEYSSVIAITETFTIVKEEVEGKTNSYYLSINM